MHTCIYQGISARHLLRGVYTYTWNCIDKVVTVLRYLGKKIVNTFMGFFRVAGVPKRATHGVDTIDDEAAVRDLPRLVLQQLMMSAYHPKTGPRDDRAFRRA